MKRKFNTILETYLQKYTRGGFLTGDMVKVKDDVFKSDFYKSQTQSYQDKLKSWAQSDLLLRVSAVKPIRPTTQATGNAEITGSEFDVDITQEIAPGRYVDFLTIPASFIEPYSNGSNLPPIPDSLKRKEKTQIKPEGEKPEDEQQIAHTVHSDDGKGKLIKGDRKLLNKNIKIPSVPAKGEKTPAVSSYTHNYLPKSK
jgi:hypothetical protein